jgi:hypothetical protein
VRRCALGLGHWLLKKSGAVTDELGLAEEGSVSTCRSVLDHSAGSGLQDASITPSTEGVVEASTEHAGSPGSSTSSVISVIHIPTAQKQQVNGGDRGDETPLFTFAAPIAGAENAGG